MKWFNEHYLVATSYPSQSFRATRHMSLGFAMRTKFRSTAEEFGAGCTAEFAAALCHLQHPMMKVHMDIHVVLRIPHLECGGFLVPFSGILPPFFLTKSASFMAVGVQKSTAMAKKIGSFDATVLRFHR